MFAGDLKIKFYKNAYYINQYQALTFWQLKAADHVFS